MTTLTVATSAPYGTVDNPAPHPKLVLYTDHGARVVLPFAPIETPLRGLADTWVEIPRAGGRRPLLVRAGPQLPTLDLEATIVNTRTPTQNAELYLYVLNMIARSGHRVYLRNLGVFGAGPWRIVDLSATPFRRQPNTNAITGFTATLSLKAASDVHVNVTPLTGGARTSRTTAAAAPTSVTVAAGETSASVAYRATGTTDATALLEANGIRDPRTLTAGTVLTVPASS